MKRFARLDSIVSLFKQILPTLVFLFAMLHSASPLAAQVISAPSVVSFGTLTCSANVVSTTIVIQNTGATTLVLSGAAISPPTSDFVITSPTNISNFSPLFVFPSNTLAIVIAYNPQRIGAQNVSLVLASNSIGTTTGITSIPLTSQRDSAGFQLSTTSIVWNNVPSNTSVSTSIIVRNTGSVPFVLPTPQFSGAFAIDSLVPNSIPPNAEGRIFTRFFGAPAGTTTATMFNLSDGCGRITQLSAFAAVQAPPSVTSFTPAVGTVGTQVTITGINLANATAVFFGGVQAQSFTVISPTEIRATVAQGASGAVLVTVGGGVAISPQQFRFIPQPSVLFFTPSTGGTGTAVTLIGTNFENVTQVRFGGILAQSFIINSPTQITAFVGNGGATGFVSATTQVGTTTSTQVFTYIPPPQILFITPQIGPAGTAVTIVGNNLANARSVSFGGSAAQSFTQVEPTRLVAVVGLEGASGAVSVVTPGGASSSEQVFTFTAPPAISFVSPTIGAQGTIVNIIGTNFTNVTGVSFGGIPAQNFVVSSPTQIIATVGASGASGNIVVSTQSGSTTASQQFVFAAAPTVSFFSPQSGIAGTAVNIFGTAFTGATAVNFGGIPARSFSVVSPTQIVATIGDQGATGNLAVVTPNGAGFSQSVFMFIPRSSVQVSSNHATSEAITLRCAPNPAANATTLHYSLQTPADVRIELLTMLGERVITLTQGNKAAGQHKMDIATDALAQGVYLCRIQAGETVKTTLLQVVR